MPDTESNQNDFAPPSKTEDAFHRVVSFARRFGEPHTALAMHAALPLGLTAELVHLTRLNFISHAPWIAEADLLLSPLCREVGGETYEMHSHVRELLLGELAQDQAFGPPRIRALAEFLLAYAARQVNQTSREETRNFLAAQHWTALAYLRPGEAARLLTAALGQRLSTKNRPGALRLANLTQALNAPLISEERTLLYATAVERLACGDHNRAAGLLNAAAPSGQPPVIHNVTLPALDQLTSWLSPATFQQAVPTASAEAPAEEPQTEVEEEFTLPPGFRLRNTLRGERDSFSTLAWSPDGRTLAASTTTTINLLDWEQDVGRLLIREIGKGVQKLAWAPDGRKLASGSEDIRIWETEQGRLLWTISGHRGPIYDLAYSLDGRKLASGSRDKTVSLWDANTGRVMLRLAAHGGEVTGVAWSPDGKALASASYDSTVRLWDAESGQELLKLEAGKVRFNDIDWSPDGRMLAGGGDDINVHVWFPNEPDRQPVLLDSRVMSVIQVRFSPDARLLAAASTLGQVRFWRCDNWQSVGALKTKMLHPEVAFHPTLPLMAVTSGDGKAISIVELNYEALLAAPAPDADRARQSFRFYVIGNTPPGEAAPFVDQLLAALRREWPQQPVNLNDLSATGTGLSASEINAIGDSDFMVTLLNDQSVRSHLLREAVEVAHNLAQQRSRPLLLPLRLAYDGPLPYYLDPYLERFHHFVWQGPDDTRRVTDELIAAVKNRRLPDSQAATDTPGGALPANSRFFIERQCDVRALKSLEPWGTTIVITGARQMGKTSLLNRMVEQGVRDRKVARVDFQLFGSQAFSNPGLFIETFCRALDQKLGMRDRLAAWRNEIQRGNLQSTWQMFHDFLIQAITEGTSPLLLLIDEVDAILESSFRDDFFSQLRALRHPQLNLVIFSAHGPHRFIQSTTISPYNVGEVIALENFTAAEVAELNRRYDSPLNQEGVHDLCSLLGGHPYLTHRAFHLVASGQYSTSDILSEAAQEQGPFGEHLGALLQLLRSRAGLMGAFLQMIQSGRATDPQALFTLQSVGLLRDSQGKVEIPYQLYRDFFRGYLSA